MIHRPVFDSEHYNLETEVFLRPQVELTHFGPIFTEPEISSIYWVQLKQGPTEDGDILQSPKRCLLNKRTREISRIEIVI
jgi:hypothetical protein